MMPPQAIELIKKLKQLNSSFKNETDRKLIKETITSISELKFSESDSFQSVLQKSNISLSISNLLNRSKVPYAILEIVYFCTINNFYNSSDISFIVDCLSKPEWDHNSRLKILQMFFYFVKLDLDLKTCFQMLELVIFKFVSQNLELDSITMPIVLQLVSIIISKQTFKTKSNTLDFSNELTNYSEANPSYDNSKKIFHFIFDSIVEKKLYFSSYILLSIVKNNEISKLEGFGYFLKDDFPQICIEVLKNGKKEDKTAIYDSILEVKIRFNNVNLVPIYKSFDEIHSKSVVDFEFLSFTIDLLETFEPNNEYDKEFIISMKETFNKILESWDLLNSSDRKVIVLLQRLIGILLPQMNLDEIVKLIMVKISENNSELLNELFIDCLKYCSNYKNENLFENGLILGYNGKINRIKNSIGQIYKNMGKFWSIYFKNTADHDLSFLNLFDLRDLEFFVDSLPPQINLGKLIYLKAKNLFICENCDKEIVDRKIKLLRKLLLSSGSTKEIMEISTLFYYSNHNISAIEMPLNILLTEFRKRYGNLDNNGSDINSLSVKSKDLILSVDYSDKKSDNIFETASKNEENAFKSVKGSLKSTIPSNNSINSENTEVIDSENKISIKYSWFDEFKFKLSPPDSQDLYFFLNELIRAVSLSQCWNQILTLINLGDECEDQKSQIILFIEQEFLFELNHSNLKMLFHILRDLLSSNSLYQSILNSIYIFGELTDFVIKNHRNTDLWQQLLSFGLKLSLNKNEEIQSSIIKHLFRIFVMNYNSLNEREIEYFENILLECTDKLKNEKISMLILEEWKICLMTVRLNYSMVRLLPILVDITCKSNEEISKCAFDVILIISKKIKEDSHKEIDLDKFCPFGVGNSNVNNLKSNEESEGLNLDLKNIKSDKKIENINSNSNNNEFDGSFIDVNKDSFLREEIKKNSEISNTIKRPSHVYFESEDALSFEKLMKKSFQILLKNCNPSKHAIIGVLFLEISTYSYSVIELKEFSKDLFKFISMEDPYRNDAIDCFIKTCGISKQFSFCLKMLSSWLSKEKIDISLSLIDKISKNLENNPKNIEMNVRLAGLSNFLDYSIQFSSSEDFLIPIFDLICKYDCIFNENILKKLLNFSQMFIKKQLPIKYTKERENALINYIYFLSNLTISMNSNNSGILVEILQKIILQTFEIKNHYFMFKMACYNIMFKFYECFDILLRNQINKIFADFVHIYLRGGKGTSFYLIGEVLNILKQVLKTKNRYLIDGIKFSLIELIIIDDSEILEYIKQILKVKFENE